MKIKNLHIYGFGKLHNVKIDFLSPNIQLFFGENEAGKSTIMAFIHAVLFGFPTKNQSELRYEPKTGFQYGGYLTVETKEYGTVKVERVSGKSTGEVTVFFEDGTTSNSTDSIVKGMEKSLFKGVFSFNIMDIQNVKLTDLNELGSYLFSSGMIGTDQLQKLGQKLEKETDALFKPGGRKPILNEMLSTLKEKKAQLSLWKEKLEEYELLQNNVERLNDNIERLSEEQEQLHNKRQLIDYMVALTPLYKEFIQLESKLQALTNYQPFPTNGVTRLESLQKEWAFFESKITMLAEQINELSLNLNKFPNEHVFKEKFSSLENITSLQSSFEKLETELGQLINNEETVRSKIKQVKESIGLEDKSDSEIKFYETTLQTKMKLRELLFEEKQLEEEKTRLDEHFSLAKEELENCEYNIKKYKEELLSEEEKNKLNELLTNNKSREIENEILVKEKVLEQFQRTKHSQVGKNSLKSNLLLLFTLSFIFIGIAIYGFVISNFVISVIAILGLASVALLTIKKKSSDDKVDWKEEEKNVLDDLTNLKQQLSKQQITSEELNRAQKMWVENEQVEQMLVKETVLLRQHERNYEKTVSLFEAWERKKFTIEEKWKQLNKKIDLANFQLSFMEEAFEEISKLKKYLLDLEELINRKKLSEKQLNDLTRKIQSNNEVVELDYLDVKHCFYLANKEKEQIVKSKQMVDQNQEKLAIKEEEKRLLTQQQVEIVKQIEHLYELANVNTEEEYRIKAEQNAIGVELEQRVGMLSAQISQLEKMYKVNIEDWRQETDWNDKLIQAKEEIQSIDKELQQFYKEKASLKESIKALESGTTYAAVRQNYENEKALFEKLAKKWSVYETAKHLLHQTMNYYQEVKLPQVLEKATKYFHVLTDGKYVKVVTLSSEKSIVVERKDGVTFLPKELSQATIEQLYLSLRFAVASTWSNEKMFPFIMDDTFVNFDSNRTDLAIKLLVEIAEEGNQLLFFTCHPLIKDKLSRKKGTFVYVMEESTMFAT
ncbi:MAG: AAA family ATPase [Bacillaceae bacterium]|nr:AAA family ATPase [Bacillaceae bacterium]